MAQTVPNSEPTLALNEFIPTVGLYPTRDKAAGAFDIGITGAIGFFAGSYTGTTAQGQTLSISQNQALYSPLGTAYGGDGQLSFHRTSPAARSSASAARRCSARPRAAPPSASPTPSCRS